MNNIKTSFTIRDLENLSGIKAHTIRIWEKRYNLLQPERTDTNIRAYNLKSLQKLLNISNLNSRGYKISKIAKYSEEEILALVKENVSDKTANASAINSLKIAMINFDPTLFYKIYNDLEERKDFEEIFLDIIIPLLNDIGILWQTDTITPANEHFITSLIRQKILINIEKKHSQLKVKSNEVFVLFLPLNEIHELGLMFLHYLLLDLGYQSIYLGPSVPRSSLKDFINLYENVTFVSYFTIKPESGKIQSYIKSFQKELLVNDHYKFWILGRKISESKLTNLPAAVKVFPTLEVLRKTLQKTRKEAVES